MLPEQGPPRHRHGHFLDRPFHSGDRRDPLDDDPIESFTGTSTPAARVRWPHRIGTVPPLAAARQERDADARLVELVANGTTAVVCQVLSGMGGVGKTQLAAAYAKRLWGQGELDLLMWVNASSRESIATAFAQAGMAICGADGDQATIEFLNWLDRAQAPRSLIVLDDLSDPDHLRGLWPPTQPNGRTIVTTRRRDAAMDGEGRVRVDVDLFTAEEAVGYLHRRLGTRARRTQGAADLAERLGRLPLALSQAAAFILDQPGLSCGDYLDLVEDRTVALAELSPDAAPDGYHSSMAAAWSLSMEQADRHPPANLAMGVLRLACLLDPAGIPVDLFATESARRFLTECASAPTELRTHQVRASLGRLHRLSLIDVDGPMVRMHALVQRAVLDSSTEADLERAVTAAANGLLELWPKPTGLARGAALRSNAVRLGAGHSALLFAPRAHTILFRIGDSLGRQGQVGAATDHFRSLRDRCERSLGADHPDTLHARHYLARWTGESGDIQAAIEQLEAVLVDRIRVLGADHRRTLETRQRLIYWRGEQGDVQTAIAESAALLADRLRVLGSEHFDALATRSMLARWRGRAGDPALAASENEALLADCLRLLDRDHAFTLAVRHNLAHWRGEAGDPEGAVAATEELLADRKRVLGPDHPDTLRSRQTLAGWRGQAGNPAAAVAELRQVLTDQLRLLGPDHPDVLGVRNDQARWSARAGAVREALAQFEGLERDCMRLLGPTHRQTRIVQHNLIYWRPRSEPLREPGKTPGPASNPGLGNSSVWGMGGGSNVG